MEKEVGTGRRKHRRKAGEVRKMEKKRGGVGWDQWPALRVPANG